MNPQELMNQITNLGNQIRTAAAALAARAADNSVSIADLEAEQARLNDMNKRLAALQAAYDTAVAAQATGMSGAAGMQRQQGGDSSGGQQSRNLGEMLRSNEYARAFAFALQNGLNRRTARQHEETRILYDALTEGGGNPTGADGGFLVPEDIDHSIRELRRTLNPLAPLFNEETVTAPTGWRVQDTAPTTGFPVVNEMGTITTGDQPMFNKVLYSVEKRGLILPVSNELLTDNVANLFAYISRWFAKKLVITENSLLITLLKTLPAVDITADPVGGLKKVLNVELDPAISAISTIITNQSGYDALDQLLDDNKRGLLQPDPTSATTHRFKGRAVHAVSDASLANTTSGSGASEVTKADLFIGDGHEFATLFRCGGFELASTDIGGNAWKSDSTEVRGIVRLGVTKFDGGAMVRKTITV